MNDLPFVEHFPTFEGLQEYCRVYLPNCYQHLLLMKSDPTWQARLKHQGILARGLLGDCEEVPLYRYFDGLEALATRRNWEERAWGSNQLAKYERWFRHQLYQHEETPDVDPDTIDRLLPLPHDYIES